MRRISGNALLNWFEKHFGGFRLVMCSDVKLTSSKFPAELYISLICVKLKGRERLTIWAMFTEVYGKEKQTKYE